VNCDEAQELITALVDNEVSATERASIEDHLKDCLKCRSIHQRELSIKRGVRLLAARVRAPEDLRERISSGQRIFPERTKTQERWKGWIWPARPILWPAFALALLFLLVLPALYLMRPTEQSISLSALQTHQRIMAGSISFVRTASEDSLKEQLTRSVGGNFGPMGYDLSMMNLQPVGGIVQEVGGRKILVSIYEGKAPSLTCYTLIGTEEDVPSGAVLFFDPEKRVNFYTFSRGGVNAVFHREGKLICILVSKMAMQDLLALARSKAQPS